MIKTNIDAILASLTDKGVDKHVICPSIDRHVEIAKKIKSNFQNAYTSIDERSAGYIASGMSAETQDVVVVWCDGNASFRNLTSALTEAYYRKLPIVVITLNLSSFAIDQSINPEDIIRNRICIPEFTNTDLVGKTISNALDSNSTTIAYPVLIQIEGREQELVEQVQAQGMTKETDDFKYLTKLIPSDSVLVIGNTFASSCWQSTNAKLLVEPLKGGASDGRFSILLGSAVADKETLHIGIMSVDEITYDLNMLGNRHVSQNICLVIPREKKNYSTKISDYARALGWACKLVDDKNSLIELKAASAPQLIEIMI